jgi:biotin carboxyl carrier protein
VQNVLFGRYKMISGQVKDYVYGMYGRSPAPIDPEVQKIVLKGYEKGETPYTGRAADLLKPEMEKARQDTKDIAKDIGDVLIYALYPQTGMKFLRIKYGLEPVPAAMKPKTLEEIKREDDLIAKALAGKLVEKVEAPKKEVPAKGPGMRTFNVFVENEYYKVEVEPTGGAIISGPVANRPAAAPTPVAQPAAKPAEAPPKAEVKKEAPPAAAEGDVTLPVPMPGTVIRYLVNVGDKVKAGDVVVMLEAMKMENAIPAPAAGTIKAVNFAAGAAVKKGEVLAIISTK